MTFIGPPASCVWFVLPMQAAVARNNYGTFDETISGNFAVQFRRLQLIMSRDRLSVTPWSNRFAFKYTAVLDKAYGKRGSLMFANPNPKGPYAQNASRRSVAILSDVADHREADLRNVRAEIHECL